ncbi:class I SAM-dependent methyltransferase [Arcobacter sp.]|uniref:class I SAM-dependent methyltransferase n=1 Tax=Arcobacter sp. TaxID=1872629 RepID=UPI003D0DEC2B
MQENNFKNIFKNFFDKDKSFIILKKIYRKFFDFNGNHTKEENLEWIKNNASNCEDLAKSLSIELWNEAILVSKEIEEESIKKLKELNIKLGGGGIYPFLYFITRYLQPNNILETGVAAGFSSYSLLYAIDKNSKGKLYSSDFPYFRLENPEQYIGYIVPDELKSNWDLLINGDDVNIPQFLEKVSRFDLIHYDSDKTYAGKAKFMNRIINNINKNTIILIDDIQDNSFFYDYIIGNNINDWYIFEFEGKYVGMIGSLNV